MRCAALRCAALRCAQGVYAGVLRLRLCRSGRRRPAVLDRRAAGPAGPDRVALDPAGGRPVTVRVLPGAWALTRWPWLVTAPNVSDQPTRLMNVMTGQVAPVKASPNKLLTCTPTCCRMVPYN